MLLSDHFGARPLDRLTRRAIEAWLGDLNYLAVNSRASYLCSVRQFTRWLVEEGQLATDPCVSIPAVKRISALPRAQNHNSINRALAACVDERERAIVWLMVGLGLRRMEVAGLRWEHYDERTQVLIVCHAKYGHERALPVTAEVARALALIRGRGQIGPMIRSRNDYNAPISPERVGYLASRILSRAGVKVAAYDGVSGHAFRHTAASDVLDNCNDLRVVQAMLGHVNLSTTAIYLRRANAGQMRDAMSGRAYDEAA